MTRLACGGPLGRENVKADVQRRARNGVLKHLPENRSAPGGRRLAGEIFDEGRTEFAHLLLYLIAVKERDFERPDLANRILQSVARPPQRKERFDFFLHQNFPDVCIF
jgi:hypothetical protein